MIERGVPTPQALQERVIDQTDTVYRLLINRIGLAGILVPKHIHAQTEQRAENALL